MGKELVIIGLVVLCLAFSVAEKKTKRNGIYSDGPQSTIYKEVDVNNPTVQEAAEQVLRAVREETDCPDASLIAVTNANNLVYNVNRGGGEKWELELRFDNGSGQTMECKVTVLQILETLLLVLHKSSNRPTFLTDNLCKCTNKEKIIEAEEC